MYIWLNDFVFIQVFCLDEEISSVVGASTFFKMKEFSNLNVGVALDEGLANPSNKYSVFYGERTLWCK